MKSVVQEKSFSYSLKIIKVYKELSAQNEFVLSKQLVRSGTSIGANVEEALAAQSRKDFLSKMSIASKEARETRYWLRLMSASNIGNENYPGLLKDVEELVKLLTAIVKTTGKNR